MPYPDGDSPPKQIVQNWLAICKKAFKSDKGTAIGVHCVAGLGRFVHFGIVIYPSY